MRFFIERHRYSPKYASELNTGGNRAESALWVPKSKFKINLFWHLTRCFRECYLVVGSVGQAGRGMALASRARLRGGAAADHLQIELALSTHAVRITTTVVPPAGDTVDVITVIYLSCF